MQFSGRKCAQVRVCTVASTALCSPFWLCMCCFWWRTGGGRRATVQSCGRRRQRASAKRMANRLEQMAPSLVNNLRQSRMYLLCSQRIVAEAQNWLRVIEALGLSLHANSRQQRPRIPFHDPSCQRRLFSTDTIPPSLLLTTAQLLRPSPSGFLS